MKIHDLQRDRLLRVKQDMIGGTSLKTGDIVLIQGSRVGKNNPEILHLDVIRTADDYRTSLVVGAMDLGESFFEPYNEPPLPEKRSRLVEQFMSFRRDHRFSRMREDLFLKAIKNPEESRMMNHLDAAQKATAIVDCFVINELLVDDPAARNVLKPVMEFVEGLDEVQKRDLGTD